MPVWIGPLAVGGIVIANVVGGGMRSITFVQAFQYWLKLTAVAVPALALLMHFGTSIPHSAARSHPRWTSRPSSASTPTWWSRSPTQPV